MRHASAVSVVLLAALLAACGGDDVGEVAATTTTTTTTTTTLAVTGPHTVADAAIDALVSGDYEAWLNQFAPDAVIGGGQEAPALFEPAEWIAHDFDGDGVNTIADWMQFRVAFNGAAGATAEWDCTTVETDLAECTLRFMDEFYAAAGVALPVEVAHYEVVEGRVARVEELPYQDQDGHDRALEAKMELLGRYESWVHEQHPDRYNQLFTEPCCDLDYVLTPDAIQVHTELIKAFLAQI